MATRIKLRRDTSANWLQQNPILAQGETGFETDTRAMKLGDGSTRWADLKYAVTGDLKVTNDTIHGDTSVSLSSGIGNRENWIVSVLGNNGTPENPTDTNNDGVAYDSLGNAYAIGWYNDFSGCYLQKISPSGEILFNNFYDQFDSYGYGLAVDKNNDIVMILGENDGSDSSQDIVLVKVSSDDGTIIWQKNINSYGDYDDFATCIDIDLNNDIFIVGGTNGSDCYIGKFNGVNGNPIWQKKYDIEGFGNTGTGVTVDKDGNLGVVGSNYWMGGFISVFKFNGSDGSVIWESRVGAVMWNNGNNYNGNLSSTDITADTNGDFYFGMNAAEGDPVSAGLLVKLNGTNGAKVWARRIGWADWLTGTGSVITDDQDNVYVSTTIRKYKYNYDHGDSYRATQQITKFNKTGSVIWQRWLSAEQAETKEGVWSPFGGQTIRVQGDYVLVGGNYDAQHDYADDYNSWYSRAYVAQLNRDGGEFEISGWSFKASDLPVEFVTLDEQNFGTSFNPADVSDANIDVTNGDVNSEISTDTTTLVYINKSNVNKVTFAEKTLTLPAGGAINVSREKLGYFSSIGSFDSNEGWNSQGDVWLNGTDRDEKGSTYSAGGWYFQAGGSWNDWDNNTNIPLVFKTDSEGKLLWSAGNAIDQYGADLVDVVYHQDTNTVVTLGNDGELDGHEGFNIVYLDADTGGMKQDITHIRPEAGSNDIYPTSLTIMSDGSPVVSGYITNSKATYADVTVGAAGLTGSTASGTLVVLKSKFTVDNSTEYPQEDGTWYLYPNGDQIYSVNRYGHDEGYPTVVYTGTLGSGATVDVTISGANITSLTINAAGSGYKPGQRLLILGSVLGGADSTNDVSFFVDTVDGSGAITAIANGYNTGILIDGTYTGVATTAQAGTLPNVWVRYLPEGDTYSTVNVDSGGNGWGVGDTFKILGTQLGGATPANDLTFAVASINGTGPGFGGMTTIDSIAGTPQSTNIKLFGGSNDFTVTGTYNVVHELNNDGFIWTPTWSKVFGSNVGTNTYDDFHGMTVDSSDNVIVSGYSDNTGLDSGTTYDGAYSQTGIITKFDSAGVIQWTKSIDGNEGASTVWGVATDTDDNIYSVMCSTNNNSDPYITKLTPTGDLVWQQGISVWNSQEWAIDIADNGDVMIVGECFSDWFANDYHYGNDNLLVVKFDKDGNTLFSRVIWSQNGVRMNNNDSYSNQLTIKGDRFSIAAYSYDPGDWSTTGLAIDLPLDGTGTGTYGDFYYEEVEVNIINRSVTNNFYGSDLVTDITDVIVTRPYTFIETPYDGDNAWRNVTIYADRVAQVQTIYKPEGGEVKGVAKITFEDGSVQTSSMQGLPQVYRSQVNSGSNDYWLRPEDNGKHILQTNGNTVIIPNRDRVDLPIGFAFTIINKGNNSGVWSENYDETIYLSGDGGGSNNSYEIPSWTMATLVKIENGQWMIAGSGLSGGWW